MARWNGVKIDAFSVGFGPELFGFNDKHGTRWKLAMIPLGGYVKFHGDMNGASMPDNEVINSMSEEERAVSFAHKKVWQRASIVAAGPIANFILAIVIFTFSLMFIGTQKFTEGLNPLVVGGLIVLIGAALGGTTGYAINPARDLGPRLAHFFLPIKGKGSSDWSYSWVPILGPFLGSLFGATAYRLLYHNELKVKYIIVLILVAIVITMAIYKSVTKKPEKNA